MYHVVRVGLCTHLKGESFALFDENWFHFCSFQFDTSLFYVTDFLSVGNSEKDENEVFSRGDWASADIHACGFSWKKKRRVKLRHFCCVMGVLTQIICIYEFLLVCWYWVSEATGDMCSTVGCGGQQLCFCACADWISCSKKKMQVSVNSGEAERVRVSVTFDFLVVFCFTWFMNFDGTFRCGSFCFRFFELYSSFVLVSCLRESGHCTLQ